MANFRWQRIGEAQTTANRISLCTWQEDTQFNSFGDFLAARVMQTRKQTQEQELSFVGRDV